MPFGLKIPDTLGIGVQLGRAARHVNEHIVVQGFGFQQQDAVRGIFRQPIGQDASRRAAADDDIIIASCSKRPPDGIADDGAAVFGDIDRVEHAIMTDPDRQLRIGIGPADAAAHARMA